MAGCEALDQTLMVVLPQLGDFNTMEHAWIQPTPYWRSGIWQKILGIYGF
jgi:hypothetical protein